MQYIFNQVGVASEIRRRGQWKLTDILDVCSAMQGSNYKLPEGARALVELLGTLTGLTALKILYLVSDVRYCIW